ncbi:hypothetical protein JEHA107958_07145 [Jeotgalicoccus halotolerans]|uniref:Uncharacterized protein n=1 Tax=Jeotgalicoccus halotolerans TaxID=157227 RepID=A0A3E0AUT9_9STAP|nr:hypothetical protein DFR63_1902 [Jeotgalicoccus halotolerans]
MQALINDIGTVSFGGSLFCAESRKDIKKYPEETPGTFINHLFSEIVVAKTVFSHVILIKVAFINI